jgi:inner membrane protein involved in colicin E2 resistance
VIDVYKTLEAFSGIDIHGDFKVTLKRGENNEYHLKTDNNLVAVIGIEVVDGVLQVKTSQDIQSSKRLELDITYVSLDAITLRDKVKLKSMNKIDLTDLIFTAFDNVHYDLDLNVINGVYVLNNNSKGELKLKGGVQKMIFNENSFLKGDFNFQELELEINDRADVSLKGDVTNLILTATGSSDVRAEDLESETANIIASGKADLYVYASKNLQLYGQGKSFIYVYGNPEIKVEGLNDKSQIIKK